MAFHQSSSLPLLTLGHPLCLCLCLCLCFLLPPRAKERMKKIVRLPVYSRGPYRHARQSSPGNKIRKG